MAPIILVPLSPVPEDLIRSLASPLESIFRTTVTISDQINVSVESVYDSSRAQYNSTFLIKQLLENYSAPPFAGEKILGITSVDLFVPILTYVFGEAQLNGMTGVMSVYRLDETMYGMDADPVLLFERTLKEAVHELGHTFGLLHCRSFECSMHSSTTVEEVDLKSAGLCRHCSEHIGIK